MTCCDTYQPLLPPSGIPLLSVPHSATYRVPLRNAIMTFLEDVRLYSDPSNGTWPFGVVLEACVVLCVAAATEYQSRNDWAIFFIVMALVLSWWLHQVSGGAWSSRPSPKTIGATHAAIETGGLRVSLLYGILSLVAQAVLCHALYPERQPALLTASSSAERIVSCGAVSALEAGVSWTSIAIGCPTGLWFTLLGSVVVDIALPWCSVPRVLGAASVASTRGLELLFLISMPLLVALLTPGALRHPSMKRGHLRYSPRYGELARHAMMAGHSATEITAAWRQLLGFWMVSQKERHTVFGVVTRALSSCEAKQCHTAISAGLKGTRTNPQVEAPYWEAALRLTREALATEHRCVCPNNNDELLMLWSWLRAGVSILEDAGPLDEAVSLWFMTSPAGRFELRPHAPPPRSHDERAGVVPLSGPVTRQRASQQQQAAPPGTARAASTACAADRLVVVFSSLGTGLIRPEFGSTLHRCRVLCGPGLAPFDVLHVVDPAYSFYLQDPKGSWQGRQYHQTQLRRHTTRYKHVFFIGDSMGGSAALLFADLADSVLAFVPLLALEGCPQAEREDFPLHLQREYPAMVRQSLGRCKGQVVVHTSSDPEDEKHCSALRGAGVELQKHTECQTHLLTGHLKETGELVHIVARFLGGRVPVVDDAGDIDVPRRRG